MSAVQTGRPGLWASRRPVLVKLGVVATAAAIAFAVILVTLQNPLPGDSRRFSAVFSNVAGLKVGDAVRLAGVRVGRVDAIDLEGTQALVRFDLVDDQPLKDSARLTMRYQNLVGQRYIEIQQPAGTGIPLQTGATVPIARTRPGFQLTALLNGFRPLFNVLSADQVNALATTTVQILQGEGPTIAGLLDQMGSLTRFVAGRDQIFDQVLGNLTPFLQGVSSDGDQLTASLHQLTVLLRGLNSQKVTVTTSIEHLSTLLEHADQFVAEASGPASTSIASTDRAMTLLAGHMPTILRSVNGFVQLVSALGRTTSYRNAWNVVVCRFHFYAGPAAVDLAPNDGPYSKVCGG